MWIETALVAIGLLAILLILYRRLWKAFQRMAFDKRSLSSRYGKLTEQFIPFMKDYPYDEQNFRFIGSPIDGVQFEDDKIVFMEFKAGESSKLTERQRRIRDLVKNGRVRFEEFSVREK
jgi:predicted Holliday junction resolvase-like endonuclease